MWAAHLEPGEVVLEGVPASGVLHLGRVPVPEGPDPVVTQIDSDWNAALLSVVPTEDVMAWKYRKLLTNPGNAFQALLGRQTGDWAGWSGRRGGGPSGAGRGRHRLHLRRGGGRRPGGQLHGAARPGFAEVLGGSTWQSLTRGTGNVETDYLNGEFVRIARRLGREAPINALVASLVRQAAARGARPGELSLAELSARLSPWL